MYTCTFALESIIRGERVRVCRADWVPSVKRLVSVSNCSAQLFAGRSHKPNSRRDIIINAHARRFITGVSVCVGVCVGLWCGVVCV